MDVAPPRAQPATREALAPLLRHYGYRHDLGDRALTTTERRLPLDLPLVPDAAARLAPFDVVDLHGLRVHEARTRLRFGDGLTVVYFGKGTGALREVTLERAAAARQRLAGESGGSPRDPRPAVAVFLSAELDAQIAASFVRPSRLATFLRWLLAPALVFAGFWSLLMSLARGTPSPWIGVGLLVAGVVAVRLGRRRVRGPPGS